MPEIQIVDSLTNAKNEFDTIEDLIQTNKEKSEKFKTTCKHVYDYIRKIDDNTNDTGLNNDILPELIVNDVDHEQIYQQLQLHNNNEFNNLMKYFSKCLVNVDNISFNIDTTETKTKVKNGLSDSFDKDEDDTDQSENIDDSDDEDGDLFSDEELNNLDKKKSNSEFGIPDGSDSEISDFEAEQGEEDDDEEENNNDAEDSDDVDEDLEDLYGDLGDEKEVMELNEKIREYRDTDEEGSEEEPVDEYEENNQKSQNNKKETKNNSKNLFENDDEADNDEDNQKSSFEKRQDKLKKQMEQIHDSMLDNLNNKPWQLKGEANAKSRPQDSLLEEYLEYDHTTRVAPQPSVDSTIKLEDMLKQRIKDKTFDDVERKIKPVEMNYEYRKQVVLDHDKSKQSLSQIYEQEYLNKKEQELNGSSINESKEKSNPKHDEIKSLLQSLFIKLDALSNFHYTPKAPLPEAKVVSNMPTIAMEEVAPINVSETYQLAPEEIHKKIDSLPKGNTEEDKKDRKKKLRAKKQSIKKVKERKEKLLMLKQALEPDNAKVNKELALNNLKKQSKGVSKNVKILKSDKKKVDLSLKSSSAFFKQLNENNVLDKSSKVKRKSSDNKQKSSKKLKL